MKDETLKAIRDALVATANTLATHKEHIERLSRQVSAAQVQPTDSSRPWESEPDRKEWTAHGLKCVIKRVEHSGHLCGYVAVPKGHPCHGLEETRDESGLPSLDVHWGVTWTDAHLPNEDIEGDEAWWVGFDCAHSGDYSPRYAELYGESRALWRREETYRDMAYVTEQTEKLAQQLAELAGGSDAPPLR